MLKPPASSSSVPRRRERPPSSSACASVVFWGALAAAIYLLTCWSGVHMDEAGETQAVFPPRLRRTQDEPALPQYQGLAKRESALRPSVR